MIRLSRGPGGKLAEVASSGGGKGEDDMMKKGGKIGGLKRPPLWGRLRSGKP